MHRNLRPVIVAVLAMAVAACTSGPAAEGNSAAGSELSPQFLDLLAPTSGDQGARARESAEILLAEAAVETIGDCMADAGFGEYANLPVLVAGDRNSTHYEFVAPTKLERRGLVALADPRIDEVPREAQAAMNGCLGEGEDAAAAAEAVDRFIVFRDSNENPLAMWPEIVRTEIARIADANDPGQNDYRECFRQIGVPADVAANPATAMNWLIGEMNTATPEDIPPATIEQWRRGGGVLDADGGQLARAAAGCFRLFEAHLTPRLEALRRPIVDAEREQILRGQQYFQEAIGAGEYMPDGYDL